MIDPNEKIKFVELVKHDPAWFNLFSKASNEIKDVLGDNCIEIYHIGSSGPTNAYKAAPEKVLDGITRSSIISC